MGISCILITLHISSENTLAPMPCVLNGQVDAIVMTGGCLKR